MIVVEGEKEKVGKPEKKEELYKKAVEAFENKLFPSITSTATHYGVSVSTLRRLLAQDRSYIGCGKKSSVLSEEEEKQIVDHVLWRADHGCGLNNRQLSLLIQELIQRLREVNPQREFPSSWLSDFPDKSYITRFKRRHNLVLHSTMNLSIARAQITSQDLDQWFRHIDERFVQDEILQQCFADPRRIFNCDETAIEWGNDHQKV